MQGWSRNLMVSNRKGAGATTKAMTRPSVRDPKFGKEVFQSHWLMKAKIPVRWMSNSQEGSSEKRFTELFISHGWLALSMRYLLVPRAKLGLAVLPVSKSENLTAG
jgi:hypothetical protein